MHWVRLLLRFRTVDETRQSLPETMVFTVFAYDMQVLFTRK